MSLLIEGEGRYRGGDSPILSTQYKLTFSFIYSYLPYNNSLRVKGLLEITYMWLYSMEPGDNNHNMCFPLGTMWAIDKPFSIMLRRHLSMENESREEDR